MPRNQLDALVAVFKLFGESPLNRFFPNDSAVNHRDSKFLESLEIQLSEDAFFDVNIRAVYIRINFEHLLAFVLVTEVHHR